MSAARVPWWLWVAAAVVVAGLLALPLGGWRTVERTASSVETLEAGQRHEADQFTTTVQRAEVVPVRPGSSLDPKPGIAYLAVYARVENRTEGTVLARSDLLVVEGDDLDLGPADATVLVVDPTGSPELQPGLPADLAYVWQVDEGAVADGAELRTSVVDRTATESLARSGTIWLQPRVGAVVDLTVAEP